MLAETKTKHRQALLLLFFTYISDRCFHVFSDPGRETSGMQTQAEGSSVCRAAEQMDAGQSGVRKDRWERVLATGEDVGKAAWSL